MVGLRGVKHVLVAGLRRLGGVTGVSGMFVSQPGVTGTGVRGAAEVEGWAPPDPTGRGGAAEAEGCAAEVEGWAPPGGAEGAGAEGGGNCKEQEWIL